MYSAADIEVQLWEYIDNVCDDATRERIANLIATDKAWKDKYAELMAFHSELQQMEPEHTSMRFTKNVMEQIAGAHVAQPTKSYINKWVVRSIAAVFILLIGFVLIYFLQDLQWSNEPTTTKKVDYTSIFNNNFVVYVVLANILIGMVIVDMLIRRKRVTH